MSFDNQILEKYNVKLISSEYTTYDIVNDFLMNNQSEQPFYIIDLGEIIKLYEKPLSITQPIHSLDLKTGDDVIERKILLQGKISRRNWIYAESVIVPSRLDEIFRERLLKSQEPIGRLWVEHRVETFKEIIDSARERAGDLSNYFKIKKEDKILSRTYRVFSNRQPIMIITEKFPESYFV